jgi:hypothetical protein
MKIKEFLKRLKGQTRCAYRILPPLDARELEAWQEDWPGRTLPEDLLLLLRQANGIQFWVHEASPEGYLSLLPLREIDSARRIMWDVSGDSMNVDWVPYPHWLAISGHQDGSAFIVLDTDNNKYYLMDSCGADLTCPQGDSVQELLDYIWEDWVVGMGDLAEDQGG